MIDGGVSSGDEHEYSWLVTLLMANILHKSDIYRSPGHGGLHS